MENEAQTKRGASESRREFRGRLVGIKPPWPVAVLLAVVAGVVDSTTFMALFGLFVAQVTGSFVTLGVHIVTLDKTSLVSLVAIPFFFIGGVVVAMVAAAQASAARGFATALAIEAAMLLRLRCGRSCDGAACEPQRAARGADGHPRARGHGHAERDGTAHVRWRRFNQRDDHQHHATRN